MPLFSPIFITPSQRASIPVSPRDISKAVLEEEKVELTSSVNISHKDEFAEGYDECDDEEGYPDVI